MIYSKYIKVFFDKLLAGVLGILLFPGLILIFILLFITQGNPVFYMQLRSGKNQRKFKLYKFRTLVPSDLENLSMENRHFTFFGNVMRRSGLDELPQLINILNGEMSFVGPRPLPTEYEKKYNEVQNLRLRMKPGITGWAQIHGKNDISWDRRFDLDLWYVNHVSLFLDIKICLITVIQFITSIFNPSKKHVEMEVFNGSKLT